MAHHSRYLGETGHAGGGDAGRALADVMILAPCDGAKVPGRQAPDERGITFVVRQIEGA